MRSVFRKKDELDIDITVYRPNAVDNLLIMLFIVFNTIIALTSTSLMAYNIRVFVFGIFNIIFTLFLFLAASYVKRYSLKWSFIVIAIGVFQLSRLIFMPDNTDTVLNIVLYALSGIVGILAGIDSVIKTKSRALHMEKKEL